MVKEQRFWNRNFILTMLIACTAGFAHQVFNIIFPVYILDIGGTNALTGMMFTGLTVAGLITRLLFGNLIDTWGRKKMLLLGSSLFLLNNAAYLFVNNMAVIFLLRIFNGVSQGFFFPVPPTIVSDNAPKNRLVDAVGYFGIAGTLPIALASTVGMAVYRNLGSTALFLLCSITSGVAVILAAMVKEVYQPTAGQTGKTAFTWNSILEVSALTPSFICLFLMFGNSSVTNFLTPCGLSRGLTNISLFFTVNTTVACLARMFVGRITARAGQRRTLAGAIILSAASFAVIGMARHMAFMYLAAVTLGIGATLVSQLTQVYVLERIPQNRRGVANTTWMLSGEIGTGAGSLVWGFVSMEAGYLWTYLLSGATVIFGLILQKWKLK